MKKKESAENTTDSMMAILYSTVSPHNHYSNDHKKFQEVSLSCRFTICGIVVLHIVEARTNMKYVSERLGHASIKTTADTYLHITKKMEDDALKLYQRYTKGL